MSIKIDKKITNYQVISASSDVPETAARTATSSAPVIAGTEAAPANVVQMHERVERPERLIGSTYKIKTPLSDHALYVTINDIVLNPETPYEKQRPFEIFINSKNMDHFQWIVALTRIISAVFRKGGDVIFLVEELRSVFDPQGGYFKPGGKYTPSLVAEIGDAIESHMKMIGMIPDDPLDEQQKKMVLEKRRELAERVGTTENPDSSEAQFPPESLLCPKCSTKAVILMDGCDTCLNCGYSKCS